ncbi:hypothetical protein MTO96_045916 [Rhipicephalus appendiculatus]
MIVNQRNPKALEAKRIKTTTTVVVLFDGMKVPNYVMCGVSLLRCTLYKRQNDVCYACGGLGHRADVCPNPNKRVCKGLWARLSIRRSPVLTKMCPLRRTASHGGQNVQRTLSSSLRRATEKTTAPKACQKDSAAGPGEPVTGFQRIKYSQAGGVPSRQLAAGAAAPGAALTPGVRIQKEPTWADRAKPKPAAPPREVTQAPLPEHREDPRVAKLIQENACLKAELHQLRADLESFRKSYSSQGETQQTPPTRGRAGALG